MSAVPSPPPGWQPLATIVRAHGTSGAVRVRLAVAIADLIAWPLTGVLTSPLGRADALSLGKLRQIGRADWLADLGGRLSREEAARLAGQTVYLPPAVMPPLGDDQIYLCDLLGRQARQPSGDLLGCIVAVYDHGAGDILALSRQPRRTNKPLHTLTEDLLLPLSMVSIVSAPKDGDSVVLAVPADLLTSA